jgi:hypothetical protein
LRQSQFRKGGILIAKNIQEGGCERSVVCTIVTPKSFKDEAGRLETARGNGNATPPKNYRG